MAGALTRGLKAVIPCLVLGLILGLVPLIGLSGCSRTPAAKERTSAPTIAAARSLQEVAPPAAVTQLKTALDRHQPAVTIQAPADGSLMPPGDWALEIEVRDWPLVDAGALGLGPHLVVQIDDQAPIRTTTASLAKGQTNTSKVRLSLDPLAPGSHRITAYAARPWGEAVKAPGASSQITVHRVAPTPLTQPRSGEPQLRPVSPPTLSAGEPVLIDWLLWDAPLQHLREDDTRWRLRITVNGDSFQVDRQLPLWLKGFKPGSNAVVLELLDGLGEPIAPTLNTLVQEVIVRPGERPLWSGEALSADQLAVLLGETPTSPVASASTAPPRAAAASPQAPAPERPALAPNAEAQPSPAPAASAGAAPSGAPKSSAATTAAPAGQPGETSTETLSSGADGPGHRPPGQNNETPPLPEPVSAVVVEAAPAATGLESAANAGSDERPLAGSQAPAASPPTRAASGSVGTQTPASPTANASSSDEPSETATESDQTTDPTPDPSTNATNDSDNQEAPMSASATAAPAEAAGDPPAPPKPVPVLPSARSELNADGTLIRPKKQGLFSGLRGGAA